MSPENDQTRWIGVRPTNPAEDIPVTLDGEVPHVIVDSGCEGGMPAGQPKVTTARVVMVANVYQTLIDYTGKGAFRGVNSHSNASNNTTIKITVDGGVPIEVVLLTNELWKTVSAYFEGQYDRQFVLDWGLVVFDTSLKVEFKNSGALAVNIACFWQTYS